MFRIALCLPLRLLLTLHQLITGAVCVDTETSKIWQATDLTNPICKPRTCSKPLAKFYLVFTERNDGRLFTTVMSSCPTYRSTIHRPARNGHTNLPVPSHCMVGNTSYSRGCLARSQRQPLSDDDMAYVPCPILSRATCFLLRS